MLLYVFIYGLIMFITMCVLCLSCAYDDEDAGADTLFFIMLMGFVWPLVWLSFVSYCVGWCFRMIKRRWFD